ncbi:hypothetical protein HDU67_002880, partial [Dinochytrium kinnereticum]
MTGWSSIWNLVGVHLILLEYTNYYYLLPTTGDLRPLLLDLHRPATTRTSDKEEDSAVL